MTEEALLATLDEAGTDGTELLGLIDEDAGTVGTVLSMVVEYVQGQSVMVKVVEAVTV